MNRQSIQWIDEEHQYVSSYVQQFRNRNIIATDDILNQMAEGILIPSYLSYDLNDILTDFHDSKIMMSCKSIIDIENKDVNTMYVALSNCIDFSKYRIAHFHIFYQNDKGQCLNNLIEAFNHIASRNSECDIKYNIIPSSADGLLIRCFYKE